MTDFIFSFFKFSPLLMYFATCSYLTSCENRKEMSNAIWAESTYFRGYQPTTKEKLKKTDVKKFALKLKRHNIKYAYIFAGPYGKDGHLPEYAFSQTAIQTVKLLKLYHPKLVVLPWIGGVQNSTVYLNNTYWTNIAINDTKKLVNTLKTPGVHVDLEFILPGNNYLDTQVEKPKKDEIRNFAKNVNNFHKLLRASLPNAFISSVVVPALPDTKPWKRKTTNNELKELMKYVDQISFLFYDTSINDNNIFRNNCRILFENISNFKKDAPSKKVQFLVTLGTFNNYRFELDKYRNLHVENISNTLDTFNSSIKGINRINTIDGISIYCDWQTDTDEWNQLDNFLLVH